MKRISFQGFLLSSLLLLSSFVFLNSFISSQNCGRPSAFSSSQSFFRISPQPIYVNLQALQEDEVTFFQSIPQNFEDHVATINVSVLGILVSSNAKKTDLYTDAVGNLWLSVKYSLKKGDYISTLTWVSSETFNENLTVPEFVSFPETYPGEVVPFLSSGVKIPVDNETIATIAESLASENMIQTIENVLNFVNNTQTYNREKAGLLLKGSLNVTDIMDFINDPLTSLESNNSFCFERALLAASILRAARVPTRTFTNIDLKTWIQVWLPNTGWVDAEVLCTQPAASVFPRSLSFTIPRMIENSSDAMFPFTWNPKVLMRVANLTLANLESFNINDYCTVISQPVSVSIYEADAEKLSFPIIFEPEIIRAALTRNGSYVDFHLSREDKNISKRLIFNEVNRVEFEGLSFSFKPVQQDDIVVLSNFSVQELWIFYAIILTPFTVAAVSTIVLSWVFWKRRKAKK